jgi:hypothetical protein
MAQQILAASPTTRPANTLLHRILWINSLSSAAAGTAAVVASGPLASFMGVATPLALMILGLGLLLFAGGVYYTATRETINRRHAWIIFELDVAWIIGSALILLTDAFSLSTGGRWAVLILADLVLAFAIVEFIGLRRLR